MTLRYHKRVQLEVNTILKNYYQISDKVGEGFWNEFLSFMRRIESNPERYGFLGETKFRRVNFETYPYTVIYKYYPQRKLVRIFVVRHFKRPFNFGLERKF